MALRGGQILAAGQRKDFFLERSFDEFIPSYLPQLRYRGFSRAVLSVLRSLPLWPLGRAIEELGRSGLPTLPHEQSRRLLRLPAQALGKPPGNSAPGTWHKNCIYEVVASRQRKGRIIVLLVKNAQVFAPEPLGRLDILAAAGRIIAIAPKIDVSSLPVPLEILEAEGQLALPGLIDSHVHIIGGGGEGGYATRTPELLLSDCVRAGVSTVIGTLGTDGLARSMESLVAKAYALRAQGLSVWIYTGSYRVPPATVTGDIMKDIMMIEPIIGAGELAVSDHRSSRPTMAELGRIVSEARVGGLLSGKAGVINFHIGDAPAGLGPLEELVAAGDIPRSQFIPTHCNRNPMLFQASLAWAAAGGWADLTTSTVPSFIEEGEVPVAAALRRFSEAGLLDRVTCSSDGQGSLPLFDGGGVLVGLTMGSSASLWKAVREAILGEGLALEAAAKTVTANPAKALKLPGKGRLAVGADADILLLGSDDLEIRGLVAGGRTMMAGGELLAKDAFGTR